MKKFDELSELEQSVLLDAIEYYEMCSSKQREKYETIHVVCVAHIAMNSNLFDTDTVIHKFICEKSKDELLALFYI